MDWIGIDIVIYTVIGTVIATAIFAFISYIRRKLDEDKIVDFLKNSLSFKFRSTTAISSELNISSKKVEDICSKSKKIIRNKKEKESWRLAE